jgi:hypothetical protein
MFIRFTRKNGLPIYINASFVVTVEPLAGGGSAVVPIGDGLDYEVLESPERVLEMLSGAPAPAVVPVPSSDSLTVTPEDVSGEGTAGVSAEVPPPDEIKIAKRTAKAKAAKEPAEKEKAAAKKPARTRKAKKAKLELDEKEIERLVKLAPKTHKKLVNTLTAQFSVADAENTVAALQDNGLIAVNDLRVEWLSAKMVK